MIRQYYSTDKTSGYIRYWQIVTDDWIRIIPTLWGMFGYAYSQGNLSSQFRIDLKWNSLIPISEFDKLSSLLNFAFENENNNENNYRIIVNSLRMMFDDWWLTYDPISQRPPAPLFKSFFVLKNTENDTGYTESQKLTDSTKIYVKTKDGSEKWHYVTNDGTWSYVLDSSGEKTTGSVEYAIDFVAKQNEKTKEKIDQYIKSNYYVIAANDKNGNDTANLISKNVKFNCLYGFVKGIILAQYTNEMKSEYNNTGGITLKLNGKIFATLLNDLLLEYGFTTLYDEYTTPTVLFIQERYGFLKDCINLQSGFCNESEPDIFISSPARDIREPLSGK